MRADKVIRTSDPLRSVNQSLELKSIIVISQIICFLQWPYANEF